MSKEGRSECNTVEDGFDEPREMDFTWAPSAMVSHEKIILPRKGIEISLWTYRIDSQEAQIITML